jgi:hypothetical protein
MDTQKTTFLSLSLAVAAVATPSVVAAGCIGKVLDLGSNDDNAPTLFIRNVLAPLPPAADGGVCAYTATTAESDLATGLVDVAFPLDTYTPELLVGNQAVGGGSGSADTSRVIVQGATTTITDLDGDMSVEEMFATMCEEGDQAACAAGKALTAGQLSTPINPFETIETIAVDAPDGSIPSYAAFPVTIIDGVTIEALRYYFEAALKSDGAAALSSSVELVTRTELNGMTLGGASVESNDFEFAVVFTYGQLASNLEVSGSRYCLESEPSSAASTCVPGQDAKSVLASAAGVPACATSRGDGGVDASSKDGGAG